ncbi:MAG: amino acid adenylation domain-containing protein [Terriglobales bacterium]
MTEASAHAIPRLAGSMVPLSFAQQQVWLHAQLVPEIPIYNEPVTVRRDGPLDVAVLERALTEIVRRHQAWRTAFTLVNGEPVQVVRPVSPVHLRMVDLTRLPASKRESEAERLGEADAILPFDLSQGPLFRALLVRFGETQHRLFLTLHHIIFDGYSIYRVLLPELVALYQAFSEGRESPLPEPSIQYPDFALWERDWFSRNGHLSSQLAYWRKQLGGALPVVQLPSDHPRRAMQSFRGAIHPVVLSRELGDALKLLSRRERATLFMTLMASFAVLLHRYSALEDVAIGTVSSGRKRSQLEGLLGYFLNPVVLRNDLSGDPTFRQLLNRTRNLTLDALSNDDAPFTEVVNELHPNRSLSFNPLFQVLLTLEPPMPDTQEGWTVALTQSEIDTGISKFDLCLELDDRPSGIVGRFKYSRDLFEPETVARMASHLSTLLQGIVADPDQHISKLPMLTAPEQRKICVQWNQTEAAYPSKICLHQLFSRQAAQTPEAVALVDGDRHQSYRELDCKSNQLAAYLQKCGVGPEVPVGLYLEPSPEMILGILGVLKAGGVCVPLDPSYPADRLKHVSDDTRFEVLLTQSGLPPQLPAISQVLNLDSDWVKIEDESADPVQNDCRPENLAYLIYTSGSTGKPKGVQITHRNLVHSTCARSLYYGAGAGRFLLLSSYAFDSSLVGIFGTLCGGGTLVLTPGPLQSNLTRLADLVQFHQVSHLLCVPSLYSLLLDQAKAGQLASLRTAIVAGESCPPELVKRHYALLAETNLFNEYGPTEAAVWSTVYKCAPEQSGKLVPIGRPIPNARVYILDKYLNPLPVGVPGEFYVGGPGVARGYLNRPQETSERFIQDPFSRNSKDRLYKTGDLVRYLPSGDLELIGRVDRQVKIRGFRIELEEIEAVIAERKEVEQVAVAVHEDGSGEPKLTAYIVPGDRSSFDKQEIRSFLGRKLPEAMIPSDLVLLDSLPLMPNGKIDRHALPAHARTAAVPVHFEPSGNVLEAKLVKIWESVLSKPGIGVTDNFFDLGGHSLLVAKLLLRIDQRFGKKLSLANVFEAPTIRQLAAMLAGQTESMHHPALVPIQPLGSKPPLYWVRGGSLFLPLAKRLGTDQPLLALHLPVSDARRLPVPYRFEDIAAALVARLREVQPEGPYYLAGLCVNGVIAYEMARQLVQQGQQVPFLALFDAQNPAYYEDYSQESHRQLASRKLEHHWRNLRKGGVSSLPRFIHDRFIGTRLRARVRYWRIYCGLHLRVSEKSLQDLETIIHPTSFAYRPQPYPRRIVFFQSSDWPGGRYWDFYASWNDVCRELEVHKIRGGHETMFYEANVDLVANLLQDCLARSGENASESMEAEEQHS